jgi:cation:H+ antiporter
MTLEAYPIYLSYLLIVAGFVFLIMGADWLVNGASGLAKRFNVPDLVIGLTVVAFGTSAPELVVNLVAAIKGSSEIALTNILGSNIINTLVILGVSALIYPVASQASSRKRDIPLSIFAGFAVLLLVLLTPGDGGVNRWGGVLLLVCFCCFMFLTMRHARKNPAESTEEYTPIPAWKAVGLILVGLLGLIVGGQAIVASAQNIARSWGVSEHIIGLTVVALGTSLPELATSAMAAYKKNSDLAIGNVIGSNIFNVFFVLGVSACIRPLASYDGLILDAFMAGCSSLLLLGFLYTNRERKLQRWQGFVFLCIYAVYLYTRL